MYIYIYIYTNIQQRKFRLSLYTYINSILLMNINSMVIKQSCVQAFSFIFLRFDSFLVIIFIQLMHFLSIFSLKIHFAQ